MLQLRLKSYCVRAHARQISIPSPFRELQSLFGFLSLDFLAALNSVAQQNYVSIGGHYNYSIVAVCEHDILSRSCSRQRIVTLSSFDGLSRPALKP